MTWTRVTSGRYVSPDGYTIERQRMVNSFGEPRTQWRVTVADRLVAVEGTLTAAKVVAEAHKVAAKPTVDVVGGPCRWQVCPGRIVNRTVRRRRDGLSLPVEVLICDRCLTEYDRPAVSA